MNLNAIRQYDKPTSINPLNNNLLLRKPTPIPDTPKPPARLRNLPDNLPPVPDGFALWGWGPLDVLDSTPFRNVVGMSSRDRDPEFVGMQVGGCRTSIYAIREGTQLAADNGHTCATPAPAPMPYTETHIAERIEQLKQRVHELEKALEREQICHAACGVIANANTPTSLASVTKMHPDYTSASVQDCIRATQREIELREQLVTRNNRIGELTIENRTLTKRKAQQLEVSKQWDAVSDFVRHHPDSVMGDSITGLALEWLKQRDELRLHLKHQHNHIAEAAALIANLWSERNELRTCIRQIHKTTNP